MRSYPSGLGVGAGLLVAVASALWLWRSPAAFASDLPGPDRSLPAPCESGAPCAADPIRPPGTAAPAEGGTAAQAEPGPSPDGSAPAAPVERPKDVADMDLGELSSVRVYAPSRRLTSVELAPSVVTVITADDIARRGYKTLYEALGDVAGFQELTVAAWGLLSNRGLVEDNNASYLFLVDGHSMANVTFIGYYEEYRFPLLAKVERIEVIRGPGSTLWGSNASMGIINVVTKDGSAIDDGSGESGKVTVGYDHEFTLRRDIANVVYGKRFGEGRDLLLTFTFSNSNARWTDGRIAGPDGLYQPPFLWFRMNQWDYEPSVDAFFKYRWDGLRVEGGVTHTGYMQPFYTPFDGTRAGSFTNERSWIDVRRSFQIVDGLELETRAYGDDYSNVGKQWKTADSSVVHMNENKATTAGVEPILHYGRGSVEALLGLSANYGAWTIKDYNDSHGVDQSYAVFTEASYSGIPRVRLTAGLRLEWNRARTDTGSTLPRLSAIFGPWHSCVLKYSYNTGFVRFGANFSSGKPEFVDGIWRINGSTPQRSRSHDLQLNYRSGRGSAAVTVYRQTLTSVPAYVGTAGPVIGQIDGVNEYYGTVGISELETYGVELEGERRIGELLKVYGNAAYQHARWGARYPFGESGQFDLVRDTSLSTEDLSPTSVPTYTWNVGVNLDVTRRLLLNVHYRGNGHTHVKTRTVPPGFETIGAEHFVDATVNYAALRWLDLSVYAKNLLDNSDPLPHINSGFIDQPLRRQLGLEAIIKL